MKVQNRALQPPAPVKAQAPPTPPTEARVENRPPQKQPERAPEPNKGQKIDTRA
jgi:hypothetical protein